jgi:hypothetical protein
MRETPVPVSRGKMINIKYTLIVFIFFRISQPIIIVQIIVPRSSQNGNVLHLFIMENSEPAGQFQ